MQTENNRKMCKHIKDKDSYFFPTTPSALFQGKKSARKWRVGGNSEYGQYATKSRDAVSISAIAV